MLVFCLLALSGSSAAATNDAFVTFYNKGSLMKAAASMPGTKHNFFMGVIFDGQQNLGFLRLHRFMTMRFPAGEHVFSASESQKHPAENSRLVLNLEPGKNYFIAAEDEAGILTNKGRLEVVSCEVAHTDLQKTIAIEEKHVPKDVRDRLVQDKSLPECH
jgi:hypothetical protein